MGVLDHPHHVLSEYNERGFHAMVEVATIEVPLYLVMSTNSMKETELFVNSD